MKYIYLCLAFIAVSCNLKKEEQTEDTAFELRPVIAGEYETLQLAEGVEAEMVDSCDWPYSFTVWNKSLLVGHYPHSLIGNIAKSKADKAYTPGTYLYPGELSEKQLNATAGYQTGLFPAPWGGVLMAAMPFQNGERFVKGNIWWLKDSTAVKLDALGSSSFVGLFALETAQGRAVIYYSDQGIRESYLYKFVADSGTDLSAGRVYVCDVHAGNWIPMDVEFNAVLKEKYGNNKNLLLNLNEAVHFAGIHMVDPFSCIQMDPLNGNILLSAMPEKQKTRMFGGLYQIAEAGGKYDGTYFKASSFIFAGLHLNFTHVSHFMTDSKLNIWVVSGIPEAEVGSPEYTVFGGNALMVMPRRGPQSRLMLRVAVAPGKERFSGLIIDSKKKHLYTFLISTSGKAKLLRLKGKGLSGLLDE